MLHLVFQTPLNSALIERIGNHDDVVFQAAAVWNTLSAHAMELLLKQLVDKACCLYVLEDELEINGIRQKQLLEDILVIDYSGLVDLTVKNSVIKTWR